MDALDHVCTELLLVFRTLNDGNPSLYVPKLSEMVMIISEFNRKFINYIVIETSNWITTLFILNDLIKDPQFKGWFFERFLRVQNPSFATEINI